MPADVTAAILAGGQGNRVGGRDKGLMLLAGKPLVARVRERLEGQAGAVLICSNRHAQEYAAFGRVTPDEVGGFRGPLAGIATALAVCATPWLLTVPVDSPNLPSDLAKRLHARAMAASADVAVVGDGIRRQPLFALYRRELAGSARAALDRDSSVWKWQDECGAIEVDCSGEAEAFMNLNSIDEFRRWERTRDA